MVDRSSSSTQMERLSTTTHQAVGQGYCMRCQQWLYCALACLWQESSSITHKAADRAAHSVIAHVDCAARLCLSLPVPSASLQLHHSQVCWQRCPQYHCTRCRRCCTWACLRPLSSSVTHRAAADRAANAVGALSLPSASHLLCHSPGRSVAAGCRTECQARGAWTECQARGARLCRRACCLLSFSTGASLLTSVLPYPPDAHSAGP